MDQDASGARERLEGCRRAVDRNPASAAAHLNLGTTLLGLGLTAEAEREFRRALEIDPDLPEALVNLGGILLSRWEFQACAEANARAAARRPGFLLAHHNQGLACLYLGRAAEVVACFRRVLEIDPGHAGGNYYLAVGLLAAGQVPESRFHMDRAVAAGFSPQPEFIKALQQAEGGPAPAMDTGG